jgi:hypothetical protein
MQPTVTTENAPQDTGSQNSYYDSLFDKNASSMLQKREAQANVDGRSAPGFGLQGPGGAKPLTSLAFCHILYNKTKRATVRTTMSPETSG